MGRVQACAYVSAAVVASIWTVGCGGSGGGGGYSTGGNTNGGNNGNNVAPTTTQTVSWTVMVFADGATGPANGPEDLSGEEFRSIKALESVGSSSDVHVLVEFEPTAATPFGSPPDTQAKRFRVIKDTTQNANAITSPILDVVGNVDCESPDEIASFMTWSAKNFPANHYALILLDHGNQWLGWGQYFNGGTTVSGTYAKLQALSTKISSSIPSGKLDVLGFDACLMAGVEVADVFKGTASVMVASEEVEILLKGRPTGGGFDYSDTLQTLVSTPSMDARALATTFVQNSATAYQTTAPPKNLANPAFTISAIDLSQIQAVETAFTSFVSKHAPNVVTELTAVGLARSHTEDYDRQSLDSSGNLFANPFGNGLFTDFPSLVANLSQSFAGDPDLAATATALQAAIFAHQSGSLRPGSSGLSIFMPTGQLLGAFASAININGQSYGSTTFGQITGWAAYLSSFYSQVASLQNTLTVKITSATDSSGNATTHASATSPITFNFTTSGADEVDVVANVFVGVSGQPTVSQEIGFADLAPQSGSVTWNAALLALSDGTQTDFLDIQPVQPGSQFGFTLFSANSQALGGAITVMALLDLSTTGSPSFVGFSFFAGGLLYQLPIDALNGASITVVRQQFDTSTSSITLAPSTSGITFTASVSQGALNLSIVTTAVPSGSYTFTLDATDFAGNDKADALNVSVP